MPESPPLEVFAMSAVRMNAKQEVEALLEKLPDGSSLEDIQYHLYVLEKIKRGRDDIAAGRTHTHEEVRARMQRWLQD
jgi:hypothetical protein